MAPTERTRFFQMRISSEEVAMLTALADADGVSNADVLRTFIRRAYVDRFGAKKPKTTKR